MLFLSRPLASKLLLASCGAMLMGFVLLTTLAAA